MKKHVLLLSIFTLFLWQVTAQAQIINTVAGGGTNNPGDGGQAIDCELNSPTGVAVDAAGNFYICERDAHRVRKVTPDGTITTIAGTGVAGYSGDGGMATAAMLNKPYCILVDVSGSVLVGDQSTVRKISSDGFINTIAGIGVLGFSGDGGPATMAEINGSSGLATDIAGNIYLADFENNRIRKINTGGIITTIAGTGSTLYNGDNIPATNANLYAPAGVAVDNANNIFITDYRHHRIRKVTPDGIITTIAGTGIAGYSGDGVVATLAQFDRPIGITVDDYGNVYIGATYNNRVRKISSAGIVTTIAGNGLTIFAGDGGPATVASVVTPTGVGIDASGNLLVCDFGNRRIRRINNVVSVMSQSPMLQNMESIHIFPNPSNGTFNIQVSTNVNERVTISITDIQGRTKSRGEIESNNPTTIELDAPTGVYVVRANTDMWTVSAKVLIQH